MEMSYLCIMTFWLCLAESSRLQKKHVYNSVLPSPLEQVYNISSWIRQLHLQQCVLVEIGEKYCGVFIEFRSLKLQQLHTEIQEYFLGLCDTDTLRKWRFCPSALEKERPKECNFQERPEFSDTPTRVHRRLCDVTDLAFYADLCDCSGLIAGQQLHKVLGFPTCFLTPLPESLCRPRNVCGIASCNASTLGRQIHIVQCNPKCLGGQPFCEPIGLETSQASQIDSYWSDWHELSCNNEMQDCLQDLLYSEATCINRNTGMGAIDCLGPGTNCCPENIDNCKCYIYTEDGVLKLIRQLKLKIPKSVEMERLPFYDKNIFMQYRPTDKVIDQSKPLIHRRFERVRKLEEDYEDDSEDVEDANDEDIVLEEEEEVRDTTTETKEKDEMKQNQHIPEANTHKYAIEQMAKDVTKDEESNASRFANCFIYYRVFSMIVIYILLT